MDKSVEGFYTKNADQGYIDLYEKDHGPRLDWLVDTFGLKNVTNSRIVDIGGGLGFLGKRLDSSNDYWVIDGAEVPKEKRLCKGTYLRTDLDYVKFADDGMEGDDATYGRPLPFDYAFCLETLEHLTNPYNCLAEIKKLVKPNGMIFISIPHYNVTHNYLYPALMASRENFQQFLDQMALPTVRYELWPKGWNAHTWCLRNAGWEEAKMLFPKHEAKFHGKTPVEYVNL